MSTTISHTISIPHESKGSLRSLFSRFLNWSAEQQENRIAIEGIGLLIFGCFLTPLTVMAVTLSGTNTLLLIPAIIAMEMTLVANLATLPTKITIPVFFLGLAIDISIVIISMFNII